MQNYHQPQTSTHDGKSIFKTIFSLWLCKNGLKKKTKKEKITHCDAESKAEVRRVNQTNINIYTTCVSNLELMHVSLHVEIIQVIYLHIVLNNFPSINGFSVHTIPLLYSWILVINVFDPPHWE